MKAHRPTIMGTRHMVAACQYLAAEAGFRILEAGGNAIDAGVAAGIALGVVQPEYVNFAGVAPIIIYSADENRVITISGLGGWPKALERDYFQKHHGGKIPKGVLRTVVPAAPDAWITALAQWGTMSFGEVAASAIDFARDGFPVYPLMSEIITEHEAEYREFPSNVALYLPHGRPPQRRRGLRAEGSRRHDPVHGRRRGSGRGAARTRCRACRPRATRSTSAISPARSSAFQKSEGGLLSAEDLASYRSGVEAPVETSFGDIRLYGCGPWCQGPSLLQALNLLDARRAAQARPQLGRLHSPHDRGREARIRRPRGLFRRSAHGRCADRCAAVARLRDAAPRADPPRSRMAGNAAGRRSAQARAQPRRDAKLVPAKEWAAPELDTSYVCVVDREGNVFSATPSDGSYNAPVVPGLGIIPSSRGSQNWADPDHPSGVAPGKRPRLTPNPAIAMQPGKMAMPFGTPGGDVQTQAMLQVFLNINLFGMEPQEAVEAPRFATYSFPSSFEPHAYHPGRLNLEGRIDKPTGEALRKLGHKVEWWPEWTWLAGAVCTIIADQETGVLKAGADPRRPSYAVGL